LVLKVVLLLPNLHELDGQPIKSEERVFLL
jgi:hypothetical protein